MIGWKALPLGDIAESVDYGVTASSTERPVGPKFLRITDIQDSAVNWEKVPWCECDMRSASDARLNVGDIVFARTGATTGKSLLISECPTDAVFASYLIRVRLSAVAEPRFVSHFFQTPDYWAQIAKNARGVAQPGVNATTLKALKVPLPPLPEQRRIAAILDKADELRAKCRAAIAKLDSLTQSIFLDMFGDPDQVSARWPIRTLGSLLDFLTSGSRGWNQYYADSGDLFLRIQNVRHDELLLDDIAYVKAPNTAEAKRTQVEPGDVLLSITADLGRTAVVPKEMGKAYINQHLSILRTKHMVPRFLSSYLSSPGGQRQIVRRNRHGVKAGLNFDDIRSFLVPLPPIEIQHEFNRRVVVVEKLKAGQRAYERKLNILFASLQHLAFRGEL